MPAPNVGVCKGLLVLVAAVGVIISVVLFVLKGGPCHDNCSVLSVQVVMSLPKCVSQGVLLVSGMETVKRVHLGDNGTCRDMPVQR